MSARPEPVAEPGGAPLLGAAGAGLALAFALVLCWPIWLTGADYAFADTASYLRAGEEIWRILGGLLPGGGGGAVVEGGEVVLTDTRGNASTGRSVTYAAAAFALWTWVGPWAVPVLQGWLCTMTAFSLVAPEALARPGLLAIGGLWLAFLTPLPFYAVFLMPDLLAAVPILFGACLVWRWDALGPGQKGGMTAITALAATSHYGTMPLAFGCVAVALGLRSLSGLGMPASAVAAAILVSAAGPAVNLAATAAVPVSASEGPSTAPLRLPILLARSLEDGPARWYLEDACPDAAPATCAILGGDIPANVGAFLWSSDGIRNASHDEMAAIRSEEAGILARAFLAYPVEQTASLLGNAARQTVLVGVSDVVATDGLDARFVRRGGPPAEAGRALVRAFDAIVPWSLWLGVAASAALLATTAPSRAASLALLATVAGLAGNALIFGGLSAPVERYQSRVIWVLPFAALAVAAASPRRRAGRLRAAGAAR